MRIRGVLATFAHELEGCRVVDITHKDAMWAFRIRLGRIPIDDWSELEVVGESEIPNDAVLHYRRDGEHGTVRPRFSRVRLGDPYNDRVADWVDIGRSRLSNDEVLAAVDPADAPLFGD